MREPTLLDMEALLHDRIEVSTDPYLKLPKQNFLSRSNIIQSKATNVIKIRVYIPQESTQRKKANRLKENLYFVKKTYNLQVSKVQSHE